MGDVKNLVAGEAIEKLNELVEEADICLFTTGLTNLPLSTRPMSTQKVDEDGNIWFLSGKSSNHNQDIQTDKRVQLFYSNKGSYEFVSVYGEATILQDKEKAKELWTPIAKAWFHDGVDDPELTLIKVTPIEAYYWDTKNNKVVSLLKIAVGAMTGKTIDNGVEGTIKI